MNCFRNPRTLPSCLKLWKLHGTWITRYGGASTNFPEGIHQTPSTTTGWRRSLRYGSKTWRGNVTKHAASKFPTLMKLIRARVLIAGLEERGGLKVFRVDEGWDCGYKGKEKPRSHTFWVWRVVLEFLDLTNIKYSKTKKKKCFCIFLRDNVEPLIMTINSSLKINDSKHKYLHLINIWFCNIHKYMFARITEAEYSVIYQSTMFSCPLYSTHCWNFIMCIEYNSLVHKQVICFDSKINFGFICRWGSMDSIRTWWTAVSWEFYLNHVKGWLLFMVCKKINLAFNKLIDFKCNKVHIHSFVIICPVIVTSLFQQPTKNPWKL